MSTATAHAHTHDHKIPLWGLFLALLALTGAEVGLYEVWLHGAKLGDPFIPKYAMVLIILIVLTLPKAAIVMIYFMHLKFEKQFVLVLSLVPLLFAAICVLGALSDIRLNQPQGTAFPAVMKGHDLDSHGDGHGDDAPAEEEEIYY